MDRSRPRTPANLSESIHRQLNMYALAASAAGVGLLALTQSAEAKIIYTPAHRVIGKNGSYPLALNHKLTDFNIVNSNCTQGSRCNSDTYAQLTVAEASFPWAGNAVLGTNGSQYLAAALKAGAHISGARRFIRGAAMVSQCRGICNFSHSGTRTVGPWRNVTNRYPWPEVQDQWQIPLRLGAIQREGLEGPIQDHRHSDGLCLRDHPRQRDHRGRDEGHGRQQ